MAELTPEIREELKALIRESVAEELDARQLAANKKATEDELKYWVARGRANGDFA